MSNGRNDVSFRVRTVEKPKGKAGKGKPTCPAMHPGTAFRHSREVIDGPLDVVQKFTPQARPRALVEIRRVVLLPPGPREEEDHRHLRRLRASAMTSSAGMACTSPRRYSSKRRRAS